MVLLYLDTAFAIAPGRIDRGGCRVAEASPVYRPRHPERTPFHRLFEDHFDRYLTEYEDRYEPRYGYLRPVVPRTVSAFLECGRLDNGPTGVEDPYFHITLRRRFQLQTHRPCPIVSGTNRFEWDGQNDSGQHVVGGIYFIEAAMGHDQTRTKIIRTGN